MIKPYNAINTFSRRPVIAQIVTYFVFLGEMLTFFICMYVNYKSTPRQIAILVLYVVTVITQIIITLRVSCIDPSDNIMIQYRTDPQNRHNINVNDCLYCDICTSYVKETSRHCKVCQRCVEDFDHHCMWVNNCVGSKNYIDFMLMIVVTLVNMLVYIVGMILLWTEDQWREYVGPMIALWVFSFVPLVFSILLINLVALHIYLIVKGLTTYQFIVIQRQQARRKALELQKMKELKLDRHQTIVPVKNNDSQQSQQPKSKQLVETSNQELKTDNNFKSHQKSDIIFGNNDLSQESKTQKSIIEQSTNEKKNKKSQISIEENQKNLNGGDDDDEQPSPLNSKKQESQVNISQFFMNNKSIKFFIGDEIGSRPKSSIRHKKSKDKNMYHSVKVNRKDAKQNQSLYVSQLNNKNEYAQSKLSSHKAINAQD